VSLGTATHSAVALRSPYNWACVGIKSNEGRLTGIMAQTQTKASIANKLARATVPAHFFLAALVAIGVAVVTLEDI
jgi:hypothetical protein